MSKGPCTALILAVLPLAQIFAVQPSEAIQDAAKKGKPAVVLITDSGAPNMEHARKTGREAAQKIKGAVLIEVDRSVAANAALINEYRLSTAPVPLFLVFASNGVLAGGQMLGAATPDSLAKMIPTPKKAEVLKAIQGGSAVLLIASKKGMEDQAKAMQNCATACGQIKGKSTTIQVDLSDPAEQLFLQEIRVDPKATAPTTVVLNAQGQIAGTFTGAADVGALVQAASKKAGGCCPPGGSTKGCATPTKKG